MIKRFLMWSGRRSHNVQVQAGCALFYGLLSIYGFGGTCAIIMKLRKIKQQRKPPNAMQRKDSPSR
jgi:hypothetical protein